MQHSRYLYSLFFTAQGLDDGLYVAGGDAQQHREAIVGNVDQPAVVFIQEGQPAHGRRGHIHKIDVGHAVIEDAVDIHGRKHQHQQKFEAVEIVAHGEGKFSGGDQLQRQHHNGHMVAKVLHRQNPHAVERGGGGQQQRRNAAQQAAGDHEAIQKPLDLFVARKVDDQNKNNLNGVGKYE